MRKTWLTRNLVILTLVSLTQDAASELLYPLLPILLTTVLGAAPIALGLIEGAAEAAAGFAKLWSGKYSDRIGRKPFVAVGYSLAGIGKALVVFSMSWGQVLFGRVTDRIGKGIRSAPRDALITDSVAKEHLGKAFGFHRMGDNLGAVIGPLFALWGLIIFHDDVRKVAVFAIIPAILSAALTFFVKESFFPKTKKIIEKVKAPKVSLSAPLKRTIALLVFIQLMNIPDVLILLRLSNIGFSTRNVVLLYIFYNAVATIASIPAGIIADRIKPQFAYAIGLSAFGIAYLLLGTSKNHLLAVIALGIYGLFPAFTDGVGKSWIGKLSNKTERGRAQGLYQASMNFAVLGAGIWGGALWRKSEFELPLVMAGIGAFIGVLILLMRYSAITSSTDETLRSIS
ncbi:MAG: MFS transporter [Acidobacteria bacterium]|nr:MFS transporter [Acidobacteriota bacterium]